MTVLPRGSPRTTAAGAEEGVVPHSAVLKVGVVEGIGTRDPLCLDWRGLEMREREMCTQHNYVKSVVEEYKNSCLAWHTHTHVVQVGDAAWWTPSNRAYTHTHHE